MANSETVYEAIVALSADNARLRSTLRSSESVLQTSLGSMTAMAKSLIPVISLGGAVAFGKSVVDAAGQLTDLAAQTQISAQFLSGIKNTLEESGSSVDTFARAVFTAQKNLGGVDDEGDKAAQALGRVGLSVEAMQGLNPEQFIETIGKALEGIADPAERAAIGADIFGKSWQEIGPIIGDIATRMDELKASGMTEQQIADLDTFGDAITRIGNNLQIVAAGPLADFAHWVERIFETTPQSKLTNEIVKVSDELDKLDRQINARRNWAAGMEGGEAADAILQRLIQRKDELLKKNQELSQQQSDMTRQQEEAQKKVAARDATARKAKEAIDAAKEQAKATTELVKINRELDQVGMSTLAKSLDDIHVKYAEYGKTAATAFKGQKDELDAFNVKLDQTKSKIIGLQISSAGKGILGELEQKFNVKFEFTEKTAMADLSQKFVAAFQQMKDDPGNQTKLQQIFNGMVKEAVAAGVPDIPEMFRAAGLSGGELSRLTAGLTPELLAGFENSRKAGEQWGAAFAKETAAMQEKFHGIATSVDNLKQKFEDMTAAASKKMLLEMDTAGATTGLNLVIGQLNGVYQMIQRINATPVQVVQ